MTRIFSHTDSDGDKVSFFSDERAPLSVEVMPADEQSYIGYLSRDAVRILRDALNRWLDEQQRNDPNPAGKPVITSEPIYTALVRRLVAEEVARVLPLHLAPQAAIHEYATNTGVAFCSIENCHLTPERTFHAEHDPEPQAVGHPEAPAVNWSDKLFGKPDYGPSLKFDYCTECGHSWGAHPEGGDRPCTAQLGKDKCTCTRRRGAQ